MFALFKTRVMLPFEFLHLLDVSILMQYCISYKGAIGMQSRPETICFSINSKNCFSNIIYFQLTIN